MITLPTPPTSFSIERKALDKDLTEGRLAPEKVAILDIVISFIEV
jgi:hypothetical protein